MLDLESGLLSAGLPVEPLCSNRASDAASANEKPGKDILAGVEECRFIVRCHRIQCQACSTEVIARTGGIEM